MLISSFMLLVSLPAVAAVHAQTSVPTRTPTIDQSLEMQSVASPKISPDGKRVIYEQSRTNWEADAFETDLWVADVGTGERHCLRCRRSFQLTQPGRRMASGLPFRRTGRGRWRNRQQTRSSCM